jgi:methionine biosynthesis protein MetW
VGLPKYHLDSIFDPECAHPDDAHSILMRLVPPGSRVLELGCASGYLSGYLEQKQGCRVTGLEYDADAARIAANRMSEVHVVNLDDPAALDAARASSPYDVLLAAAVLEHLRDPEAVLRRARTLLRDGARVIVSLPNIAHWSMRLNLLVGRFQYTDYGIMDRTHLHFYTVDTGRRLLEEQGFPIESFHIAGSGLQNLIHRVAQIAGRPKSNPILPGLFAYEMIYVASVPPQPTRSLDGVSTEYIQHDTHPADGSQ